MPRGDRVARRGDRRPRAPSRRTVAAEQRVDAEDARGRARCGRRRSARRGRGSRPAARARSTVARRDRSRCATPSISRIGSPGRRRRRPVDRLEVAPDHQPDHRGGRDLAAWPSRPTSRPSRSTTTRSAQAVTSSSRCEMKMTLTPEALQVGDDLEQPVGLGQRQARGRLVHDHERGCRATAPWRSRPAGAAPATGRRPGVSGAKSTPRRAKSGAASACELRRGRPAAAARP